MIDIKQLTQDKTHLTELWKFLGLPQPMPDLSLEMMTYGTEMVESAFKAFKKQLNTGTVVKDVKKYLGKMLHNAKIAKQTPEQRSEYISTIRATAGELGARQKHANELKAARAELAAAMAKSEAEVLPEFASGLPEFAHDLPVVKGLRFKVKGDRLTVNDQRPASPPDDGSTSNSTSQPRTKTKGKIKTCRQCGSILQRDKPCECYGGSAPNPPQREGFSPSPVPSSGNAVPASQEGKATPPIICRDCCELLSNCTCLSPDSPCEWCGIPIPSRILSLHLIKCPAKNRMEREAAAGPQ